jgi:hypothetical protein
LVVGFDTIKKNLNQRHRIQLTGINGGIYFPDCRFGKFDLCSECYRRSKTESREQGNLPPRSVTARFN